MPIQLINERDLPKLTRETKISRTPEWRELSEVLQKGIPKGQVLQISFTPDTLKKSFGGDPKKAVLGFVLRLRSEYADRYRFKVAGSEIWVTNKAK